jgi:hypothetical protein
MVTCYPCCLRCATNPEGALLVGNAEEVVEKIVHYSEALGSISRLSFQMNTASLPHAKLMRAIEAIGTCVVPALRERIADESKLEGESSVMSL